MLFYTANIKIWLFIVCMPVDVFNVFLFFFFFFSKTVKHFVKKPHCYPNIVVGFSYEFTTRFGWMIQLHRSKHTVKCASSTHIIFFGNSIINYTVNGCFYYSSCLQMINQKVIQCSSWDQPFLLFTVWLQFVC